MALTKQVKKFPSTRYMGSKQKLLQEIWDSVEKLKFETVLDLFSGSGVVGYMFKAQGKRVISNDYMVMASVYAKAMIENNHTTLTNSDMKMLYTENTNKDNFVKETFKNLYFKEEDNEFIDLLRANIPHLPNQYKRAIAMAALIRACTKKRPRGIFTYTGFRYDDGRRDIRISLKEQFEEAVNAINSAVFDNGKRNMAKNADAMNFRTTTKVDLVYIDPPYYSRYSDNEYIRRYHFLEGLARNWEGVEIQEETKTKKFKSYPTPFSTERGAEKAFDNLFKKYKKSNLLVSYSSNCLPTKEYLTDLMKKYKKTVKVIPVDYSYSFGNQRNAKTHRNIVSEYLFLGYD